MKDCYDICKQKIYLNKVIIILYWFATYTIKGHLKNVSIWDLNLEKYIEYYLQFTSVTLLANSGADLSVLKIHEMEKFYSNRKLNGRFHWNEKEMIQADTLHSTRYPTFRK